VIFTNYPLFTSNSPTFSPTPTTIKASRANPPNAVHPRHTSPARPKTRRIPTHSSKCGYHTAPALHSRFTPRSQTLLLYCYHPKTIILYQKRGFVYHF
jgi:hypothetical protein